VRGHGDIRSFGYLVIATVTLVVGAIAAWLLIEAVRNYGGDCWDRGRRTYQLASSGLAVVAALSAGVGLYGRWHGGRLSWLLPLSLPILVVASGLAVLLVGCGG
jgi:hypothetical protein